MDLQKQADLFQQIHTEELASAHNCAGKQWVTMQHGGQICKQTTKAAPQL